MSRCRFAASLAACLFVAVFAQAQGVITSQCHFHVIDAYNRPLANQPATLKLEIPYNLNDPPTVTSSGSTDANGDVSLWVHSFGSGYKRASCFVVPDTQIYAGGTLGTGIDNDSMTGTAIAVPKAYSIPLANGGNAELYQSGAYDKPVVIAEPFNQDENTFGRKTAPLLWMDYNGDPGKIDNGGLLVYLYSLGYDVWLVRSRMTGDDLVLQGADFAEAVDLAHNYSGYNNYVAVAGYSMGGLIVHTAMAKWATYGNGPLWVNLIAALDSPLRGALVSNDLQHAFWNATFNGNGAAAHEHNMDSCSAQQMLENACHKINGCDDCLECNDRGWYAMFNSGSQFQFCNPYLGPCVTGGGGLKTCSGVGFFNMPNEGWPVGPKKIAASQGKIGEPTNRCYGDANPPGLDRTGGGNDGCPSVDVATWNYGPFPYPLVEWGYLDITASTDRNFYYRVMNVGSNGDHWIDELTPGSRQPGGVADVSVDFWGIRAVTGHQLLHAGTFIPLYSALDKNPSTGAIPFDEYWTNSYDSFHDVISDHVAPGTWVNQRTGATGQATLVPWFIRNLNDAFAAMPPAPAPACGEAACVPSQGMYVSHFSAPNCSGTESYYLPYDGWAYNCRSWDGGGQCGTVQRTVTNYSARINGGPCQNLWTSGNTLSNFVTVYRTTQAGNSCGEASCVPSQGMYVSHFSAPHCGGTESYYLPYDGYGYKCRTFDGKGQCGTIHRTMTNYSYRMNGGACVDAWTSGNTLSDFVTIYRP